MAALDPRTLQLIMAMEPAAQAKQARDMASFADVRATATGGVGGAPGVALPPQPAMARGDMPEGNRLAGPVPVPAAAPMGGASTSPVRPAPDFAGVQPGLWSSGTAMPSGNRLTEIAPEQMPGGNMLGKEALPPELAGMQIGMAGPNEVAYGPPAGMQSAIATNDMPMQQPHGGGLFSGFGDDKRQFFADWLMGMGMGSTINESLAKGTQYALMSKKEREALAKEEEQTAGMRKAAAAMGVPEEVSKYADPKSLQSFILDIQKQRMSGGAPNWSLETIYDDQGREQKAWMNKGDPSVQPIMVGGARGGAEAGDFELRTIYQDGKEITARVNKATGEFEQVGDAKPGDRGSAFEVEQKLRKEYLAEPQYKRFDDIASSYDRVATAATMDNGAGDVALVYGYMKMLDPGSVVREGEFATAEQTAGIPQQVVNMYNRAIEGTRLAPEQRAQFVEMAKSLYANETERLKYLNDRYSGLAGQYEIDPTRIVMVPQPKDYLDRGKKDEKGAKKLVIDGVTIEEIP